MTIQTLAVERINVISSKPFEAVVLALEAAVGLPDLTQLFKEIGAAATFAEMESVCRRAEGPSGLMRFVRFDHGEILRKETGLATPRLVRYLVGNPLIMKEMAKHVPDAGSYAPITILVDERPGGVHLTYDRMASFLAPYGNEDALKVARVLDSKVERLMEDAAA